MELNKHKIKMGKGKKGKRQDDDDWENDLEEISKETGIDLDQNGEDVDSFANVNLNKKDKKKKKKGGALESPDGDEDDDSPRQNASQKSAFSALMMDGDDN